MVLCKCFFLNYTYFTLHCRGLGLVRLALYLVDWPTVVLECLTRKIVPDMTFNVFGRTLNPTLLYSHRAISLNVGSFSIQMCVLSWPVFHFFCHFPLSVPVPVKYYSVKFSAFCCILRRSIFYPTDGNGFDLQKSTRRRTRLALVTFYAFRSICTVAS